MEKEIDFLRLFPYLKKKFWIILICILVGLGLSFVYTTYFHTPQYRSSTQIVVNQRNGEGTNPQIMSTYVEMMKSPAILSHVQSNLENPVSIGELMSNISVTNPQNTQVLATSYTTDNPYEAAEITNTIADSSKYVIESIMNRDEEILITFYGESDTNPVSMSPVTTLIMGSLIGFAAGVVGVGAAFLLSDQIILEKKLREKKAPKHTSKTDSNMLNVFQK